jgi:hypothetical protein
MVKRNLSSWNLFVMDLKKKNPTKSFGEILKLASTLKKKGTNYDAFVESKTRKVVKKIKNTVQKKKTKTAKKEQKKQKKQKKQKSKTAKK